MPRGGRGGGDGGSEGPSATGHGGRVAILLTPDIDGTHVRIFESSQRFVGRGLIGMSSAATWIQLETIILSEVSQKEKDLMISLTCGL